VNPALVFWFLVMMPAGETPSPPLAPEAVC
jgi:hypothetical protein